jgi:HPt (histidine-containing phosphotransfer) domain-containing protein
VAEVGRALHDLHGLLSLIGATRAAELARRAEEAAAEGRIDAESTAALQTRLDAVSAELAELARESARHAAPGRGGPDGAA